MFLEYTLFLGGFVLLIFAADWLVAGASSLAKKFNISDLIIGLTFVSFGTSAPELFINVISSSNGEADLAIGNIIGSNISNIMLILGVTALIVNIPVQKNTIVSEIPFSLTAALLFGFLANAKLFSDPSEQMMISRLDGYILIFFFLLFLFYIIYMAKQNQDIVSEDISNLKGPKATLLVVIGMAGLFLGGDLVVSNAVIIAKSWGMSETFIGLTIVGVGTSLPELVTSAMAAVRKNADIAVGNVVGSNIFNLLWILGITSVINPLPFNVASNSDILVIIMASSLLILFMLIGKRYTIERWQGFLFLCGYATYIYYLIERG